jgi:hypothetical protein
MRLSPEDPLLPPSPMRPRKLLLFGESHRQSIQQPQVPHRTRERPRTMGGALCRPLQGPMPRSAQGDHGVSDPGARASNGPAPVRRVAHAIAVGVDVAVDEALFGVQSRGDLWERCVTDGDAFRPDNLVPFVRKSESLNGTRSAAEVVADCGACGEVRSPFALGCTACHRAWLR